MLKIKKFNPHILKNKTVKILIIGKCKSGKSTLITHLIDYIDVPFTIVEPTLSGRDFYNNCKILNEDDPIIINELLKDLITKQHTKMRESQLGSESTIGLVLDNYCWYKESNESVRTLFCNGRCYRMSLIIGTQDCGISSYENSNIDYIFCFRDDNINNQKRLYRHFHCFNNFSHFQQIFNQLTENYNCIIIDNTIINPNIKIEDIIFYYKVNL
jgi:hypothetical protein